MSGRTFTGRKKRILRQLKRQLNLKKRQLARLEKSRSRRLHR